MRSRGLVWTSTVGLLLGVLPGLADSAARGGAEEWRVTNSRAIHGSWRVGEIQLFSDKACTKQVPLSAAANESLYSSHVKSEKVRVVGEVRNRGKDCVDPCGGKTGYCEWCGEGNACCRKGFQADPEECRRAEGFSASGHECVAIPREAARVSSGADVVFDGHWETAFEAHCPSLEDCPPGSLLLGGVLPSGTSPVRCVVVLQSREDALQSGKLRAAVLQWPAPVGSAHCPGACRSGRYVEGSAHGACKEQLDPHGACGSGPAFTQGGTDCSGCAKMKEPSSQVNFRVIARETSDDRKTVSTTMQDGAKSLWSKAKPLEHAGEDCWGPCISGYCSFCGEGHVCCKKGFPDDMPECADAMGFVAMSHHECVALSQSGDVAVDGSLPSWALMAAVGGPWAAICLGLGFVVCRGRVWCGLCGGRRKGGNNNKDSNEPKALSGDVFAPRARNGQHNDKEDEARRKALKEQARRLEWLT